TAQRRIICGVAVCSWADASAISAEPRTSVMLTSPAGAGFHHQYYRHNHDSARTTPFPCPACLSPGWGSMLAKGLCRPCGSAVMDKDQVAAILAEIGTLLELQGENAFRTNAYHNGARAIQQMEEDLRTVVREGRLSSIPGIGATLTEKITTL